VQKKGEKHHAWGNPGPPANRVSHQTMPSTPSEERPRCLVTAIAREPVNDLRNKQRANGAFRGRYYRSKERKKGTDKSGEKAIYRELATWEEDLGINIFKKVSTWESFAYETRTRKSCTIGSNKEQGPNNPSGSHRRIVFEGQGEKTILQMG